MPARAPLEQIVARYDRVAPLYAPLEPLFLISGGVRRRAMRALAPRAGDVVLEIGCGTGRNLALLRTAVGAQGRVVGVDASPGMLGQARRLVRRRGWQNVELRLADASKMVVGEQLDRVLFSLSYSVLPDPEPPLARAWDALRPGGILTVMDLGLTDTALAGVLGPLARALALLAPGDAYSRPWEALAAYAPVETERFRAGLFYTCTISKPI